jgi:hypothetical protein
MTKRSHQGSIVHCSIQNPYYIGFRLVLKAQPQHSGLRQSINMSVRKCHEEEKQGFQRNSALTSCKSAARFLSVAVEKLLIGVRFRCMQNETET